jgi:hypothetical protein
MISINLRDEHLTKDVMAVSILKQSGLFSEKEIQKMYDDQIELDKKTKENT